MSNLGDDYRAMNAAGASKRASNRDQSAIYLTERDIVFSSNNSGAHLIVEGNSGYIDFWPGTGKWIVRKGRKGFGVKNLVNFINKEHTDNEQKAE